MLFVESLGFPGCAAVVKNLPANVADAGLSPRLGRKWQPTPVFSPGKSHGERSLEGRSLWVTEELDTT